MPLSQRVVWALLSGVLWLASGHSAQAQLRFEPLMFEARQPKLSLLGQSGTNYVIESSVNLTHGSFLFSGVATKLTPDVVHSVWPREAPMMNRGA